VIRSAFGLCASIVVHAAAVWLLLVVSPWFEEEPVVDQQYSIDLSMFDAVGSNSTAPVQPLEDTVDDKQVEAPPVPEQPERQPEQPAVALVNELQEAEITEDDKSEPEPTVVPEPEPTPLETEQSQVLFSEVKVDPVVEHSESVDMEVVSVNEPEKQTVYRQPDTSLSVQSTSTETIELTYSQAVRQSVAARRIYPLSAKRKGLRGTAVVGFSISSDGHLLSSSILRSSGAKSLDRAALSAVKKASPFRPFPQEIKKQVWDFEVPLAFN